MAALIGAKPAQVGKIRRQLLSDGVLRTVKEGTRPVYEMPGATPGNPRTPEDFNEQMTTTLYQLDLGPHTFTVLASANQRAKIDHLLDDAGEDAAILGNAILAAPE